MAIKWKNPRDVDREFKRFEARYNTRAIVMMQMLGEKVVKKAREMGSYMDRTSNLRNSIGYIVVQNGKVVANNFSGNTPSRNGRGDTNDAHQAGLDYAKEVANGLDKNKTYLVWVAGMDYAAAVEAKGYDVLQGSGDLAESEAQKQMEYFKRFLLKK